MGLQLPNTPVFIPEVPVSVRQTSQELFDYLQRMRLAVAQNNSGAFANAFLIATAINSGTSGTLLIKSGGHILVTSGIVTSVTTI